MATGARRRRSAADPLKRRQATSDATRCRSRRRRSAADPLKRSPGGEPGGDGSSPPPISGGPVEAIPAVHCWRSTRTRRRRSAADPLKLTYRYMGAVGTPGLAVRAFCSAPRRRRSAADPLKRRPSTLSRMDPPLLRKTDPPRDRYVIADLWARPLWSRREERSGVKGGVAGELASAPLTPASTSRHSRPAVVLGPSGYRAPTERRSDPP